MKKLYPVIAAVAILAACNKKDAGALVDPALSSLVPADTTLLVGIRAEDLMKTALYQKYLADRPIAPIDDFAQQTGLDLRKDVWEVLLVSNGKDSVVLGRGKFNADPEPHLPSEFKGAQRFSYKGYTLIGDDRNAVLFIGPTVAGVGPTPALKRIVDARDQTNGPPAVLAARMKEVPREAAIWAAYSGTPITLPPDASANLGNLAKVLSYVESGAFYADLRTNISAKATGSADSDQKAKELHDALQGMLGLAKLMGGKQDAKMQKLYDGIRITQENRVVNVYLEEQEDAVATVMDFFNGNGKGKGRRPAPPQTK